jgi:hypothetical protein
MDEHGYIRSIHTHLPKKGLTIWKINDNFRGGVPDAYYSGSGGDIWIEYKYVKRLPKREDTQIIPQLRPQQIKWLNTEHNYGRNVYCVVGSPDGGVVLEHPHWTSGITMLEFAKRSSSQKELAAWILTKTA